MNKNASKTTFLYTLEVKSGECELFIVQMKQNHKLQQIYTEKVFKIISSLFLSNLKLQFSDGHNALYGYNDFLARLFDMCRNCQYAETAYNSRFIGDMKKKSKRIPSGRWVLDKIKQVRYDYTLIRCLRMTERTVGMMRRHGMLRTPVDVAIDKHLIPRYDRVYNMLNIIASKFKNGTYHFNCLATINCTIDGSRACLGATLVRRGELLHDIVSKLVDECTKKGIRIRMLTVDREFFSTGVIGLLESKNVRFLMPATHTKGVKKAISEFKAGKRDAVSRHVLVSGDADKRQVEITLIMLEAKNKKGEKVIHTFATNVPIDTVSECERGQMNGAEAFVEQYRARWSIETGYRCIESMRPRTTSKDESVRVLLLFMPIILFNAWILASCLLQRDCPNNLKTQLTIKMVLEYFILFVQKKTSPSLLTSP